MSYEQPKSRSDHYSFSEGWMGGFGEIAEIIGDMAFIKPVEIPFTVLGDIVAGALDSFELSPDSSSNK